MIRDLRPDGLQVAVRIGATWSGQEGEVWESDLFEMLSRGSQTSDAGASRIIDRLAAAGFLIQADDLDHSRQPPGARGDTTILWILRPAAKRSGLLQALPPPLPERRTGLLA